MDKSGNLRCAQPQRQRLTACDLSRLPADVGGTSQPCSRSSYQLEHPDYTRRSLRVQLFVTSTANTGHTLEHPPPSPSSPSCSCSSSSPLPQHPLPLFLYPPPRSKHSQLSLALNEHPERELAWSNISGPNVSTARIIQTSASPTALISVATASSTKIVHTNTQHQLGPPASFISISVISVTTSTATTTTTTTTTASTPIPGQSTPDAPPTATIAILPPASLMWNWS
nr:unnamed protein product [Spirometra erinaceieuropaei]